MSDELCLIANLLEIRYKCTDLWNNSLKGIIAPAAPIEKKNKKI